MEGNTRMVEPLISFITGTYNRIELLKGLFQSIRSQILPGIVYEFVICDAGSTDGTIEWLESQSDVVLIKDGKRTGAISAFTRAGKLARGKYSAILNDDVTLFPNSIWPAIVHLEMNMKCGAVAYKENRPMGDGRGRDVYKTNAVRGIMNGQPVTLIYAQCGMFRTWLCQRLNWWTGEHEEMLGAYTYGGDNSLSAQIQSYGYSIDEVDACIIEDHIANDELREINYQKGIESNDSHFFFDQYDWSRGGIIVPNEPTIPQQDRRAARILYMPVYEPGWEIQKHPIHGKHGLRNALARGKNKYGVNHIIQEYDYLADSPQRLQPHLMEIAESFKPDLILTQIQGHLPITVAMLAELKSRTGATIINWNGDQAEGGLFSKDMLPLLQQIDLQLITNLDVVPQYELHHIKWAYWQIGFEESEGDLEQNVADYFKELGRGNPFDDHATYPVVYLATLRTQERLDIAKIVHEFGGLVEQPGDTHATLYNFSTSTLLYRRAKVIISDNGFTSRGFVSNRLFQALASGGGVVLQQHVDGLDELTGLRANIHYLEWYTLDDLRNRLEELLSEPISVVSTAYDNKQSDRSTIQIDGTAFVRANFSFDAQVAKLMALIKERLGESKQLADSVALKYVGSNTGGFGLGNMWASNSRYEYQPGHLLYVRKEDVEDILKFYPNDWVRMEI